MKLVELRVFVVVDNEHYPQGWIADAISENLDFHAGEDIVSVSIVSVEEDYVQVKN